MADHEVERRFALTPIGMAFREFENAWTVYSNYEAARDERRADSAFRKVADARARLLEVLIPLAGVLPPARGAA